MSICKNDPTLEGDIIIEISKNSSIKLEYEGLKMVYDRALTIPMPCNYGSYIKGAIQEDGDHLDAIVLGPEIEVEKFLNTSTLEPLAIIDYWDTGKKDVKVIFCPKKEGYSKQELNNYLYQISNYLNYLYYYKVKPNYVTSVFYSPLFYKNNLEFRNKIEKINYEEKNLKTLIESLLS